MSSSRDEFGRERGGGHRSDRKRRRGDDRDGSDGGGASRSMSRGGGGRSSDGYRSSKRQRRDGSASYDSGSDRRRRKKDKKKGKKKGKKKKGKKKSRRRSSGSWSYSGGRAGGGYGNGGRDGRGSRGWSRGGEEEEDLGGLRDNEYEEVEPVIGDLRSVINKRNAATAAGGGGNGDGGGSDVNDDNDHHGGAANALPPAPSHRVSVEEELAAIRARRAAQSGGVAPPEDGGDNDGRPNPPGFEGGFNPPAPYQTNGGWGSKAVADDRPKIPKPLIVDEPISEALLWQKNEEEYNKRSNIERSRIRVREGRPKPVDLLAKIVDLDDFDFQFDTDLEGPLRLFSHLRLRELEDLSEDVDKAIEADPDSEYWSYMKILTLDKLRTARLAWNRAQNKETANVRSAIHTDVSAEVNAMFVGKTYGELVEMEDAFKASLEGGMAADQEYWDDVMARLSIAKATAAVNQVHKDALKIKLAKLKAQAEEQGLLTAGSEDETDAQAVARLTDSARGADDALAEADRVEADRVAAAGGNDGKPTVGTVRAASAADGGDGEEAAEVIAGSKAEAAAAVAASIQKAGDGGGNGDDDDGSDDEILLDDDDEQDEHKLEEVAIENPDMLWWADRYRPRKPKYMNRVLTGYAWNKYTQTHFDPENPPPTIIKGYNFQIFLPDLINKTQTPKYWQEYTEDPDWNVLYIESGPPYETIAFKIPNREWNFSYRRGFKAYFDRGIFYLRFRFKRMTYRA